MKIVMQDLNNKENRDEIVCNNRDDYMMLLITQVSFHDNYCKMFKEPSAYYHHFKNEMNDTEILKNLDQEYNEFLDVRGTSFKDMLKLHLEKSVIVEDRIYDFTKFEYKIV